MERFDFDPQGMRALKEIEGLEKFDAYFVDVLGNVWSTKSGSLKRLSPAKNRTRGGYLFVILTDKKGAKRKWFVHQLVARAFLGERKEGEEVNHKNRNGLDNRADNLEWCSREENIEHLQKSKGATLDEIVISKAKELHSRLLSAGTELPDLHCFVNALLEGEIDRLMGEFLDETKSKNRL